MGSLATPPNEDHHLKSLPSKKSSSNSKTVKKVHRVTKRAATSHAHHPQSPTNESHASTVSDGRHKRVWKACERCRMKKTKCDGEFPCKRCKDDGLVCIAGSRKKTEYKQLPPGYAEVLESTQFALIATVHKLYAMVRSGQKWDLGEPELNGRGQPVIHNIASKLGCIRPNSDIDLPVHSIFPEDDAGLAELARQLEKQQLHKEAASGVDITTNSRSNKSSSGSIGGGIMIKQETDSFTSCERTDRASSSELDHSDFEQDYRRAAFGSGGGGGATSTLTMSPASLNFSDFDMTSCASPSDGFSTASSAGSSNLSPSSLPAVFSSSVPWMNSRPAFATAQPRGPPPPPSFLSSSGGPPSFLGDMEIDMLNQGLVESNFGTLKPHLLSCPNPEVMMGMGDPMIYSGYDADTLRL